MENITQADEVSTETMVYPSNNVHPIKYHSPLNQRKRKALQEPRVSMAFKALKTLVDKPSSRKDRYDTYGEYLAGELRQLDEYSAAYVQKLFGDIIFDAKMGKYKEELMTYVQTTSLSHSPLASSPTTSLSQVNVTTIQQDREKFNVS